MHHLMQDSIAEMKTESEKQSLRMKIVSCRCGGHIERVINGTVYCGLYIDEMDNKYFPCKSLGDETLDVSYITEKGFPMSEKLRHCNYIRKRREK